MGEFFTPKWSEMTNFEKIMLVLEWVIVIVYIAMLIIFKLEIPVGINYLLPSVFLLSGLVYFRTRKELAIINIVIAIIGAIIVTCNIFMP